MGRDPPKDPVGQPDGYRQTEEGHADPGHDVAHVVGSENDPTDRHPQGQSSHEQSPQALASWATRDEEENRKGKGKGLGGVARWES